MNMAKAKCGYCEQKVAERHKKFLNPEEAAAEIVKDLFSSEPEQVKLFADVFVATCGVFVLKYSKTFKAGWES